MASDEDNENEGRTPADEAKAAAARAAEALEAALAAKNIAQDAARAAEYEAKHSDDDAKVVKAAKAARSKGDEAVAAWNAVGEQAGHAKDAAKRAESAVGEDDAEAARAAADEAEDAAAKAVAEAERAEEAAKAARAHGVEAEKARLELDAERARDEEGTRERVERGDEERLADHKEADEEFRERRPALLLAEFETPASVLHAASKVRDGGFEKWDVHTPYPIHGMDKAMGLESTKIGFISFTAAMIGLISAVLMMQYCNNWDYPIVVGGKPPGALPSMVPIMFELTVLLCGFGTFFGLLGLMKLPRHHHPVFYSDRFAAASDDRFFVSIEAEDPKFDPEKTRALLESLEPSHVELIEEDVA